MEDTPNTVPAGAEDERHLSPEQLAVREGVSLATVYQWNSRGGGPPFIKIAGRLVRYRLADVIAWENAQFMPGREAAS